MLEYILVKMIVSFGKEYTMKNKIRVASLFSGIGGFELGFKKSKMSYDLVFASEIDKYATMTFSYNFPTKNMRGDITKIDAKDIPDHDLLCGGFPCQSFSVAGKQKGCADETRGTLFFDVIRIVKEKKPKFLFLENVKNLISHDNSETIKTILKHISNCGYTFDITIINSNEAGVPQSRERTYIVGILDYKKEKFEDDIIYITNVTFVNDVKIIFKTVINVLKREGISQEGEATVSVFLGTEEKVTTLEG